MLIRNPSIKFYVLATCTSFSYLSLQSQVGAQTSTQETISSNRLLVENLSDKVIATNNPSSLKLPHSSRTELISKLKAGRIASTEAKLHEIKIPPRLKSGASFSTSSFISEDNSDLIRRLKRQESRKIANQITPQPTENSSELIRKLKAKDSKAILEQSSHQSLPSPTTIAASSQKITIKEVQVLGSTVFSKSELDGIVQPYIGKQVQFEEILAIRTAVTDYYTKRGFTTSGAFLPPQDVSNGVVNVQVVEGILERVEIQGLKRLREGYVRDRIRLAGSAPINLRRLETALQLLQVDPLFTSVQAELKAGTTPGRSILALNLKEARPFNSSFIVENRDSPSVGSVRGTSSLSYQNLLGFGDKFTAQVGYTRGANSYDLAYSFPVNARDGSISFRYADSNSRIIEEPFSPLDILGRSKTFSLGYRQPLVTSSSSEFTLGFTADLRESQTYLLKDIPFSFSTGPEDGKSKVTVLRFSQDWINRTPRSVLAARSQFSLGLGALGATVNDTGVDGRFFSWIGQFQWVQNLGKDFIGVGRIAAQLTPDSLLPLEQFSIGGVDTIRGYRQNQFVADNGLAGSFELRIPVVNKPNSLGNVQIAPFFDFGKVWNNNGAGVDNSIFASTGLGVRWQIGGFAARLDWGLPLTSITRQGNSLQDNGLFFSLTYQP